MLKHLKNKNKLYRIITTMLMDAGILVQCIMFIMFDIAHKPEALVNYVITFIVMCMTRILAMHYLSAIPNGKSPQKYYFGIIVTLFMYAFTYTVHYTIPHDPNYKIMQTVAVTLGYFFANVITLLYSLAYIQFYSLDDRQKKTMRNFMWLFFAVFVVIMFASPFFDLIFYVDSDGYVIYPPTSHIGDAYAFIMFAITTVFILSSKQTKSTKIALLSYDIYALIFLIIDLPPREQHDITVDSCLTLGILLSIYTVTLKVYVQNKIDLMQKKAELAERKSQVMISQIQPHFLYNTLSTIYMLCGDEPKLAQKTIKDFSEYLRNNMNSLNSNNCVPFEKELEHTKNYLSIEKLRYADMLNVEYDIQYDDFVLPSLTLQPIVENAVKYGVRSREDGGTVTIKTYKQDKNVYLVIHDDGMGFDMDEIANDGKTHIGIENTKIRVELMCNGEMKVESSAENGTTVTIILEDNDEHTIS